MKILVPTDGSTSALRAVKYAASIADNGSITLISVHDDTGLKHLKKHFSLDTVSDYLREKSEMEIKSSCNALKRLNSTYNVIIRIGHITDEIIKESNTGKYDLIVMGSKGRSIVNDFLIGSVAQRVLATTNIPLTFIK